MVEVMNASGVQLTTFGNHEFDVKEEELQARLDESSFYWLGTTVRHKVGGQIPSFYRTVNGEKKDCPDSFIWRVTDGDGTEAGSGCSDSPWAPIRRIGCNTSRPSKPRPKRPTT